MNLSHAYSDRARKPKSYVGVGVVAALHLVGIYALSAGLIRNPVVQPTPVTLKPLPDVVEPTRPVERFKPDKPVMREVPAIPVPVPDDPVIRSDAPPVGPSTVPLRDDSGPVVAKGPATPELPSPAAVKPNMTAAGAVCSVMPQPEVPAVNWTGQAVLQVLATVRAGRVVASEVRVTHGALDGRTRRSLQRSVESALAGYQCQGDATFQQDFAFRID